MIFKINQRQFIKILTEDANPAFARSRNKSETAQKIWSAIDKKREQLQQEVFGDLDKDLYDITRAKADIMGHDFLKIPYNLVTAGNDKLPSSVMIVNMSSSLMCPSYYLGQCRITDGVCYAQKGENKNSSLYSDRDSVLTNRWKTDLMHTQMLQQHQHGNKKPMEHYFSLLEHYINLANYYSNETYRNGLVKLKSKGEDTEENIAKLKEKCDKLKITDIRLSETGDFQCQFAIDLFDKFARKMRQKYKISTHGYSGRGLDFRNAKNITINPSHCDVVVNENERRMFQAVSDKFYNSLENVELGENSQPILDKKDRSGNLYYKCPCSQGATKCDTCGVCFHKNETGKPYTIYVKVHGTAKAFGLKHLFTIPEIDNVIQKMYEHGWITDKEYNEYTNPGKDSFIKARKKQADDEIQNLIASKKQSGATPTEDEIQQIIAKYTPTDADIQKHVDDRKALRQRRDDRIMQNRKKSPKGITTVKGSDGKVEYRPNKKLVGPAPKKQKNK